ncbi:Rrf2 family transcriptional regulator [Halalkalicoccus subterraneus]|uniref:Rrf2 family transcriptional regulator n=1 Tax=Halalkalicoccus subterraneus TaxID=2675002 RepID=UPI000EFD391B|nr:Rrf2 family transcriptional regulator [Halalkalicoccus subterraneus]
MSAIDLTSSQKNILTALVNLHRDTETTVKGETIAEEIDRNPGTIRNQMQSLKALQLVEGVPGPKGGYKPTVTAFEVLDIDQLDEPAAVPLTHNDETIDDANIQEIDLSSVHHPEQCRAKIHIQGSVRDYQNGDHMVVGPTPVAKLAIEGMVDGIDRTNNILILQVEQIEAPLGEATH